MQYKTRYMLGAALFITIVLACATRSGAFNTFTSNNEEMRVKSEYITLLRDIKTTNEQILEQAKITNQLLARTGRTQGTNVPVAPGTGSPAHQ